jgi:hypothetical protein
MLNGAIVSSDRGAASAAGYSGCVTLPRSSSALWFRVRRDKTAMEKPDPLRTARNKVRWFKFSSDRLTGGWNMRKSLLIAALIGALATPALADEVGVHVGPVGAGVTVGDGHDRDRDRDRSTTIVKEQEPRDKTTVIKKEDEDGNRSKTIIHHDND